jgi:diguanylate cyclase (GGDEF)-like protein
MRSPGDGNRVDLPFVLLAAWFALASMQLLMNGLRPPLATTSTTTMYVLSAIVALAFLATVVAWRLGGSEVMLFVLVLAGDALLIVVAFVAAGGQGQIMAGLYLLVLGLIAGLALRRTGLVVVLVVGVVGYVAGLLGNPLLDSPAYAVFTVIVVVLVTLVIFRLVSALRDQALHDQLTGALNRRGLEQSAGLAHDLASREGKGTAIVEIDLDGFKAYNDEFGHAAGDDRLARLVSDWRPVLRRTDLLARIGGDEFVVVLPGASAEAAVDLVSRMRSANDVPWTAGVSTWGANESLADALARADRLMYGHKRSRSGRETVN